MSQKSDGLGESFGIRARELISQNHPVLDPLPAVEQMAQMDSGNRHAALDRLRVELYALSSLVAEGAVGRSLDDRGRYPPYGLVRSLFTDFGVISSSPSPIAAGSLTDFRVLGKALIDTMVFHLDSYLKDLRKSESQWLPDRLGRLLALYRLAADRQGQSRMRDVFSYMYGGLQFGSSTCVQLVEAMNRVLSSSEGLNPQMKTAVIKRSIRPAYDLASVNVEDVPSAYAKLQPSAAGGQPGSKSNPAGWMDPNSFSRTGSDPDSWKIVLAGELRAQLLERPERAEPNRRRYATLGCPARMSPSGLRSPIGRLWEWSVDLAAQAGLLET